MMAVLFFILLEKLYFCNVEKISAVIITLNEEKNIARCLQSLEGIADEIVVVDSGSTDKTEEICKNFGVNFVKQKWLGYSEQKNFANSLSKFDYILSIDADEVISETLKKSICFEKNNFFSGVYCFNRLTNYCGKKWIRHCGWYPDKKIRIFNRNNAKWIGNIHETLSFSSNVVVIPLKGDLYHYSFHSIEEHIKQADKFTTLTAMEAFKNKEKITNFSLLIKPCWKFFRDYFFKGGFLDGYYGYIVCKISSFATFLKYTKLKQLQKQNETKS